MKNLLILFNPYYQSDVIQQHLKVLIENEKVAFGKIRSKLKINDNFETELETIYAHTNSENYLQLFLTDYSNLFVAKVEKITKVEIEKELIPPYYEEKNLDIKNLEIIWILNRKINGI